MFSILVLPLTAQTLAVTLSEKSKRKIERAQSPAKRLERYKKFYQKDSTCAARRLEKFWQSRIDSMSDAAQAKADAIKRRSSAHYPTARMQKHNRRWARDRAQQNTEWLSEHLHFDVKEKTIHYILFETYFSGLTKNDALLEEAKRRMPSLPLSNQLNQKLADFKMARAGDVALPSNVKFPGKVKEISGAVSGNQAMDAMPDRIKDLQQEGLGKVSEGYVTTAFGIDERLSGLKQAQNMDVTSIPGEYQQQASMLQDSTALKRMAEEKAQAAALKYLSEHPEITNGIQRQMDFLLKKYAIIPNSNDLSTATKRNSLKGKTLRERLVFAGNFQILTFDPFSIDLSPQIGYRFNARMTLGIGMNYRQAFADSVPGISNNVIGMKAFGSYDLIRNFFGYTEFDHDSPGVVRSENGIKREWQNAFFAGVGKKFSISSKLDVTIVMMYNFLHDPEQHIYPRPWSIRVGVQSTQLAMLKRKNK